MGGCRCSFRGCKVSTYTNPNAHFFHFPAKNQELLLQWVKMADVSSILDLPKSKIINKTVCVRHFRDECFMNYKRDRLLGGRAVPTLMRLSKNIAWDYQNCDVDGKPQLVRLEKTTMKHLIAPPGFTCPLDLDENDDEVYFNGLSELLAEDSSPPTKTRKITDIESDTSNSGHGVGGIPLLPTDQIIFTAKVGKTPEEEETITSPTDTSYEEYELLSFHEESAEEEEIEPTAEKQSEKLAAEKHANPTSDSSAKVDEPTTATLMPNELEKERCNSFNTRILELEADLESALKKLNDADAANGQGELEHTKEQNAKLSKYNEELLDKIQHLEEERKRASEKLLHLEEAHKQLHQKYDERIQQVAAVSSTNSNKNMATQPPTKAQLFTGIKKYLSSSMIALVRMEMFGSVERAWKPDERRTAVDLLHLGENVYKYFTEEWRFRLPALREARTWLNETQAEDEDDL